MVPVGRDQTHFLILGAMNCIKFLIPEITKMENQELRFGFVIEKLFQVQEKNKYYFSIIYSYNFFCN